MDRSILLARRRLRTLRSDHPKKSLGWRRFVGSLKPIGVS
jgi:hypothetical protein